MTDNIIHYEIIPSTGQKVLMVPYTARDQKNLLIVADSKDSHTIYRNIQNVLEKCLILNQDINVFNLPMIDVEYLIYKARAISCGSTMRFTIKCPSCKITNEATYNIDNIKIPDVKDFQYIQKTINGVGFTFGLPMVPLNEFLISSIEDIPTSKRIDIATENIARYIKQIVYNGETFKDSQTNIDVWLQDFDIVSLNEMGMIIEQIPSFGYDISFEPCIVCKKPINPIHVTGLPSLVTLLNSNENTANYFRTNFNLITGEDSGLTVSEIECMYPYERQIYSTLLAEYIKKKNEKRSEEQRATSMPKMPHMPSIPRP